MPAFPFRRTANLAARRGLPQGARPRSLRARRLRGKGGRVLDRRLAAARLRVEAEQPAFLVRHADLHGQAERLGVARLQRVVCVHTAGREQVRHVASPLGPQLRFQETAHEARDLGDRLAGDVAQVALRRLDSSARSRRRRAASTCRCAAGCSDTRMKKIQRRLRKSIVRGDATAVASG
jgi:hypothetical protein